MGRFDQRRRWVSALAALLLLATLAACAPAGATPPTSAASTATVAATATPNALPPLPTVQVAAGACVAQTPGIGSDPVAYSPAGGLVVTQTSKLGNLAYPVVQIPSNQQAQPIPAPQISFVDYAPSAVPVVNPGLTEGGGGYVLFICNPSSQAHTLSAAQVSIAQIRPFTDQLGAWAPCSGFYLPGSGVAEDGCGGADFEDEYLHAPFAADAQVGATVTATQTSANSMDAPGEVASGPLPVTLKPGQWMTIEVGVTRPSAPAYYTYAFALTVDGSETGVVAYSQRTLLAPVAHAWSGENCKAAAMQTQIAQAPTPPANRGFICP
ncbi:MAG TPA: hypothetical protein VFN78_00845 [Ktedonobacterales bacterium]|nr:hypothetical protein [Ktedonobacterales bacterium]